ncbi:MAG: DUF4249 domain-containing protein [Tannerella sp.]|jgi:hypothetical protein|nr:DUF4249 domain-containing protein [Tannerella sp.]
MNTVKSFVLRTSLLLFCCSCGESLMDGAVDTAMPIVESYLSEGADAITVKLYSMEVYLREGYEFSKPVGGLSLEINGRKPTETDAGTYVLRLGADTIRGGQRYDLSFEYQGKTVSASTTVPPPVTGLRIEPESATRAAGSWFFDTSADTVEIRLAWDDPDAGYYQIYIESPAAEDMPPMGGGSQFRRRMMQPFQGNGYTVTSREFRSTGYYSIYVYRVNSDYVDLYERIGSTDRANPSSAVRNAFGIFTAISAASVKFQVIEAKDE